MIAYATAAPVALTLLGRLSRMKDAKLSLWVKSTSWDRLISSLVQLRKILSRCCLTLLPIRDLFCLNSAEIIGDIFLHIVALNHLSIDKNDKRAHTKRRRQRAHSRVEGNTCEDVLGRVARPL